MPVVGVLLRKTPSWPKYDDAPEIDAVDLSDALAGSSEYDAHAVAYEPLDPPRRLAIASLDRGITVRMVAAIFDVDDEVAKKAKTPARDTWRAYEVEKVNKLFAQRPGYCYETRGGYRIVYALSEPIALSSRADSSRWKQLYLSWLDWLQHFEIDADPRCKDWTRLFRLPRVRRDGVDERRVSWGAIAPWPAPSATEFAALTPNASDLSPVDDDHDFPPASPELLQHVRDRLRAHGPAIEGQGGDNHTFIACAMVVHGYALSDAEAVDVLSEWDRSNVPPWGADLRTKMDSAWSSASGERGERRRTWEVQHDWLAMARARQAAAPPAPAPLAVARVALEQLLLPSEASASYASRVDAPEGSYAALLAQASDDVLAYLGASVGVDKEEPFFAKWDILGRDELTTWLVHGLITGNGIAVISAEPKAYKTWLGTEIGVALATGTPVCGSFACSAARVAYFYTEDPRRAVGNRFRALCKARNIDPRVALARFHAEPQGRSIDLTKEDECARIIASVRLINVAHPDDPVMLLVLDPLRNIHSGKESESDSMAEVFKRIRMIGKLCGCVVLIVHHAQKKSEQSALRRPGQRMRGSSAIHGFIDSGIYLEDTKIVEDEKGSQFTNTIISEVKAARGAGMFELSLVVRDDLNHEAVEATWTKGAKGMSAPTEEKVETWLETAFSIVDAMGKAEIEHAPLRTSEQIRAAVHAGKGAATAGLKVARERGWVHTNAKGMAQLTEAGRQLAEERATTPSARPTPDGPKDPATSGYAAQSTE